jgi:hypothetical protein
VAADSSVDQSEIQFNGIEWRGGEGGDLGGRLREWRRRRWMRMRRKFWGDEMIGIRLRGIFGGLAEVLFGISEGDLMEKQ